MATKTYTQITDDLDGSDNAQTVKFGFEGVTYEIDLTEKNADKMRKALGTYLEKGRKVTSTASSASKKSSSAGGTRDDAKQVRVWASERGIEIPARGRVPKAVLAQYDAAQGS